MLELLRSRLKAALRRRGALARLAAEDGMTLVEVAVTGLVVGLIALSLVGLDAVGRTTADQRRRAQAFQVAQADQERIKGLSADQIATLDQTRTVTMDGVAYTVRSKGQFLSSSANSASCSSTAAAADYAKVISTVDWSSNRRAAVVVQSVVTPRAGGSLLAQTVDQNGAALSGVRIDVVGADPNTDSIRRFGTTDADGCTIFGTLLVGDYTVTPSVSGYVDADGNAAGPVTVSTTSGNTTTQTFTLGEAGRVSAQFVTTIGSTTYSGQYAPSISWFNSGMPSAVNGSYSPNGSYTSLTSPYSLFPFYTGSPGNYANNYNVWAGKCMATQPPSSGGVRRYATVPPGGTGTMSGSSGSVLMPPMRVDVTYSGSRVEPDHIELHRRLRGDLEPSDLELLPVERRGLARLSGSAVWQRQLHRLRRLRPTGVHLVASSDADRSLEHQLHLGRPDDDLDRQLQLLLGDVLMGPRDLIERLRADESGLTMVELLVVMLVSVVVVIALLTYQDVTTRQTSRVFARVDATQHARSAINAIENRLRSSCVGENVTPIQAGSTATSVTFISKYGSAASLTPEKHTIALNGNGTLTDATYLATGGSSPNWTFAGTPSRTVTLLDHVAAAPGVPVFRYFRYDIARDSSGGQYLDAAGNPYMILLDGTATLPTGTTTSSGTPVAANTMPANSPTALPVPLSSTNAKVTSAVAISLVVSPGGNLGNTSFTDAAVTAQDSVVLRLTPVPSEGNLPTVPPCA